MYVNDANHIGNPESVYHQFLGRGLSAVHEIVMTTPGDFHWVCPRKHEEHRGRRVFFFISRIFIFLSQL